MSTAAFEQVYRRYARLVRGRVIQVVGLDDADDVCQIVWLRVWEKRASFRGEARLSTWLYQVASHVAVTHIRHCRAQRRDKGREVGVPAFETQEGTELVPQAFLDAAPGPETVCADRNERADVRRRIAQLRPVYASVLATFEAEPEDYRTAADALALSIPCFKSRLFRARQALGQRYVTSVS